MSSAWSVVLLIALTVSWSTASAAFFQIPPDQVMIANGTSAAVSFDLRPKNGKWTTYNLPSEKSQNFKIGKLGEFRISTKGADGRVTTLVRELKGGVRYAIHVNDARYDVAEIAQVLRAPLR